MTLEKLNSIVCRLFFVLSFVLLLAALLERTANGLGYTIIKRAYDPSRLLEYAVIMLVFVIALLLRQVRDELKKA